MFLLPLMTEAQIKLYPKVAVGYSLEDRIRIESPGYNELIGSYENRLTDKLPSTTIRCGLECTYKRFSLSYDNKFWMKPVPSRVSFDPEEAHFCIALSYKLFDKAKVTVEHTCWHSVNTSGEHHDALYGGNITVSVSYGY